MLKKKMEMYMNLFTEVLETNRECNPWKLANERLYLKLTCI